MSMRVLVTGGAGCIGTYLSRRLLREGCDVAILDNFTPQVHGSAKLPGDIATRVRLAEADVADSHAVSDALQGQDILVRLAAETDGIRQALADECAHILLFNNDTVFGGAMFQGLLEIALPGPHEIVVPKIHYDGDVPTVWCAAGWFVPWRGYAGFHFGADQPDRGRCDLDGSGR